MLLEHARFLSPIENPQSILDLGCGTGKWRASTTIAQSRAFDDERLADHYALYVGIWSMDVAEMFDAATVTGVDIAPIQPSLVPPNCSFEVDDIEQVREN